MTCLFCGYILLVFSVFRMAAEHVECFVPQALKCLEKTFLLFMVAEHLDRQVLRDTWAFRPFGFFVQGPSGVYLRNSFGEL